MANNCDNKISIWGDKESLRKIYDKLIVKEKEGLFLDNYSDLFESVDDVDDWGSKWQMIYIESYHPEDDVMSITGDSAWGPATGLWEKISEEYMVNIELEYSEPGMNFAGKISWSNGEVTESNEWTYYEYLYHFDNEYFWEEIEYLSECNTLNEIKETLKDTWEELSDDEKSKIEQIQLDRYTE